MSLYRAVLLEIKIAAEERVKAEKKEPRIQQQLSSEQHDLPECSTVIGGQ